MLRLFFYFNILFSTIIFQNISNANELDLIKDGEKIIFIRHAIAPGSGDPDNFDLNDCKTQRNLSQEGIEQSIKIGEFFKKNTIPVKKVFSSQWCRCKDTAKYAFNIYEEFSALNSTFQPRFAINEQKQLTEIKNYVKNWNNNNGNLIFITHYSIITALTNAIPRSGDIVIVDKKFNVLGTISTN
tara:strand:- start:335 stop:889 length:555 start_codon:yes stop_codon:yes gene_type:complete